MLLEKVDYNKCEEDTC